jgi:alpha-tubulin suppressor-like RCC1 family protein
MKKLAIVFIIIQSCVFNISAQSIDGGYRHSIILCHDGHVWTCGDNYHGQLGDSLSSERIIPEEVPGLDSIIMVSAGAESSYALSKSGEVWCWGSDEFGQLGLNSQLGKILAPKKIDGLNNIKSVYAGWFHTLFLLNDGTVWGCGRNDGGQLGVDSGGIYDIPIQIPGLSNVIAISAGYYHSLALKADGTVWAWGYNYWGQLGDGTTVNRAQPGQVIGIDSIKSIATGWDYSLALSYDGKVYAWGCNLFGQLGIGAPMINEVHPIPSQITLLNPVKMIKAEGNFSQIIDIQGNIWLFGLNEYGQLGNNSTTNSNIPIQLSSISNIRQVCGGWQFSLAIENNGSVWSWGDNTGGQLGDSTKVNKLVPNPMMLNCLPLLGTSNKEQQSSAFIAVSPNPCEYSSLIEFPSKNEEKYSFRLLNCFGQIIQSKTNFHEGKIEFFRNNIESGIYIFTIYNENNYIGSGKIIIR